MKEPSEKKRFKFGRIVILIFAIIVFCFSSAVIIKSLFFSGKIDKGQYKTTETESSESSQTVELIDNPIDFDALAKVNTDIYAWITIPNTKVDYPVLQSTDDSDDYYLNHTFEKKYSSAGSIYTQKINSKDFSDPNTLIYGHNMINGSMFNNLHKFRDQQFFNDNEYMYIYTDGHKLTYRIFAAYEYDNRHIMYSFDFSDEQVLTEYFNSCLHPKSITAFVREGVTLGLDDKIVTLSTCVPNGNPKLRYLVQGVLISDQLTK
ncbi:MAG: class B sortase [bacterium]|nr:class B sortase [bacterium]